MMYDIPINITIEADSEELAEQQLWDFFKYSKLHCGREHGFIDWESFEFLDSDENTHASLS